MTLSRRKYLGIKYQVIQCGEKEYEFMVTDVKPNSPADKAGILKKDIIFSINGKLICTSSLLASVIEKQEEEIIFLLVRNSEKKKISCYLEEMPCESNASYGELICNGIRLRTIVTYPETKKEKYPVVIFIQGIYRTSIDFPFSRKHTYKQIIDILTKNEYVTIRVERPGLGDSEGKRDHDLGFHYECLIYQTLLSDLESGKIAKCDLSKIMIMGYSIGGTIASIVANCSNIKISGIVTYGTVFTTVTEYLLENARRNYTSYNDPIYRTPFFREFLYFFLGKKLPPEQLVEINQQYDKFFVQGGDFLGRKYIYFQELDDIDLEKTWLNVKEIPILILAGRLDSLISLGEQRNLYQFLISHANTNQRIFLKYILADHNFHDQNNQLSQEGIETILDFFRIV